MAPRRVVGEDKKRLSEVARLFDVSEEGAAARKVAELPPPRKRRGVAGESIMMSIPMLGASHRSAMRLKDPSIETCSASAPAATYGQGTIMLKTRHRELRRSDRWRIRRTANTTG